MVDVVDLFSGGGGGWCLGRPSPRPHVRRDRVGQAPPVRHPGGGPACSPSGPMSPPTPPERFAGRVVGLTGGPPCQAFSSAGKPQRAWPTHADNSSMSRSRWVRSIGPRWVALEQVPEVLGYWRWIGRELRTMGYSVVDGHPQLLPTTGSRRSASGRFSWPASIDRCNHPSRPTRRRVTPSMIGPGRRPWVTMADALGWDLTALSTQTNTGPFRRQRPGEPPCRTSSGTTGQTPTHPKSTPSAGRRSK